ncbi:sensor histidine kinase [Nocardioides sp. zg-579]|uniref:Sensor histidine kinase n=1 Tax=Nocardioides marmotae TaxID=2663857 RepID=A0A6I3JE04_9ACTN|nr:histidine kinase [Nocardioides marmotae]MCR6032692.1 sensor histidine kinase [Gordonia jinghuaiqii]MTB96341.1 sensor histidine kinase [Nocardioides marmotae]QKE03175.1 sensor histidine kinase [Nocardioides marmotae]
MAERWWRGSWSGRDQVERVDLYTRQSLYVIAALMNGVLLVSAAAVARDHPVGYGALLAGGLALTAASAWALRDAIRLYPHDGPIPRRSTLTLVVLALVAVPGAAALPGELPAGAGLVIAFSLAWGLGGYCDRRVATATVVAIGLAAWLPARDPGQAAYGLLAGAFFMLTVRLSLWLLDIVVELDRGREAEAALAVAEERLRFSRDVHDVLGRRLSTIAVQAELAATLAGRGDDRAAGRMLEVRSLAHEGLKEARELARGYRAVDLDQELHGAVALLRSAGIEATLAVEDLPSDWHEPAAWVVREAVTNVLRHSRATSVSVSYDDRTLTVRNDGALPAAGSDGTGLAGVRARLASLGAGLETGRDADTFTVRMVLP